MRISEYTAMLQKLLKEDKILVNGKSVTESSAVFAEETINNPRIHILTPNMLLSFPFTTKNKP